MKKYSIIALAILTGTLSIIRAYAQCEISVMPDSTCYIPTTIRLNADFGFYQIDWYYNGNLVQSYQAEWDTSGTGTTVAGGNGLGTQLNQFRPYDVEVDDTGNLYISDYYRNIYDTNSRVLKWPPLATSGQIVADGWRAPLSSQFYPNGIAFDSSKSFYIVDDDHNRVLKWVLGANSGTVYAGGNGSGSGANQFSGPNGICFDKDNNLYIADYGNSRVQKWAPGATSGTTIADNVATPQYVAADGDGNIYVSEFNNSRILKFAPGSTTGEIVAGDPYGYGSYLSAGTNDSFLSHPEGVYVDGLKNLYISDFSNNRVQMWPAGAKVGKTIGGGNGFGMGPNQLAFPGGIRQDRWGNVYVCDLNNGANNQRIQKYEPHIIDTFTATQEGVYKVVIKAYNGCIITDSFGVYAGVQTPPSITISGFRLGTSESYATYQWLLNGEPIDRATDSVYDVTANGDYQVVVTDENGCIDTSKIYPITNYSGIEDAGALGKQISVYPNPVKDELSINAPLSINIAVLSIDGKVIERKNSVTRISVKELSSGIYYLQITDQRGHLLKMEKFVKQ